MFLLQHIGFPVMHRTVVMDHGEDFKNIINDVDPINSFFTLLSWILTYRHRSIVVTIVRLSLSVVRAQ